MDEIRLITLDPGHFHAALIQKQMYPEVSKRVAIYAPLGIDLTTHLERIARFNLRPQNSTSWELDIHASPDFLARMMTDRP
ncbi:MAG: oxidoreductase, partial [Bryobacteraceae bacterium]